LLEVVDAVVFVVEVTAGLAVFEDEVEEVVDCADATPAPKDATSKNTPLKVAAL
jgi:hypothetical protein